MRGPAWGRERMPARVAGPLQAPLGLAGPRPAEWGWWPRFLSYAQWIGLPFVGIFFSNLPALDAQTRLLTGRYLEYRVTEKA